jgi:hypothetical protein
MVWDDGDMLGLGAGSPWAMLWAKAATHHGRLIFLANGAQRFKNVSYVVRYIELVLNGRKKCHCAPLGLISYSGLHPKQGYCSPGTKKIYVE